MKRRSDRDRFKKKSSLKPSIHGVVAEISAAITPLMKLQLYWDKKNCRVTIPSCPREIQELMYCSSDTLFLLITKSLNRQFCCILWKFILPRLIYPGTINIMKLFKKQNLNMEIYEINSILGNRSD